MPWSWNAEVTVCPFVRDTLYDVEMERLVTFFLWPKHNDCVIDTFVGMTAPEWHKYHRVAHTKTLPTIAEGDCFPVTK